MEGPKTEAAARVWGVISTLEAVGFLDRAILSGSMYKPTISGKLHRKPILFQFGGEYAPLFNAANKRAAVARERRSQDRRVNPGAGERARMGLFKALPLSSPKNRVSEASRVLMGELTPKHPEPPNINLKLEAALERWKRAAERQGLLGSGQ